jgi:hypothetical protein
LIRLQICCDICDSFCRKKNSSIFDTQMMSQPRRWSTAKNETDSFLAVEFYTRRCSAKFVITSSKKGTVPFFDQVLPIYPGFYF